MINPYESPSTVELPENRDRQQDVDVVVAGQKQVIFSIFGYLLSVPILVVANEFLGGTPKAPTVTPLFVIVLGVGLLVLFGAAINACRGIFRMGGVLYPGSTRYIYAIGVLLPAPLVGLLVMFVANSKASGYLKARGIKVGFLGAKQ